MQGKVHEWEIFLNPAAHRITAEHLKKCTAVYASYTTESNGKVPLLGHEADS